MECLACPHECGIDRSRSPGTCGASDRIEVALVQLHHWEEPPISGTRGSGTVFFSHCNLHCRFCQNYDISQLGYGNEVTPEKLVSAMLRLRDDGAHNINLVSPSHYSEQLLPSLQSVVPRLGIPLVWNSNGYEKPDTLRRLEGLVQVYLPDFKYFSDELALTCSSAPRYFHHASRALMEMKRQVGSNRYDERGIIQRGMIVRHLVLPGHADDSIKVLDWLHDTFGPSLHVSLMAQYCPVYRAEQLPGMNRRLTIEEYQTVLQHFEQLGFEQGFCQDVSSATSSYTPEFDGSGL